MKCALTRLLPFLSKLHDDSGTQTMKLRSGLGRSCEQINVKIVKRSDAAIFTVYQKRYIAERTVACCRSPAKDWDRLRRSGVAFLRWTAIRTVVRKPCRTAPRS